MTKVLLLPLFFGFLLNVAAQPAWTLKENVNWKFYQYGGLKFENNIPKADSSSMRHITTSGSANVYSYSGASVSDAQGNLLFYSDAHTVWDKNGRPMPNGNNLLPSNATDATLILPVLDNPDQYYIIYTSGTIDFGGNSVNAYQLRYTKVDMTLNNGFGDVVTGQRNMLIDQNLSGQIKAVPGDSCNIWLVAHAVDKAQFRVYEIKDTGIYKTPITSDVGFGAVGFMGPLSFLGHMNVSHDRKNLAFVQWGGDLVPLLELYDFNPSTGKVSNARIIDTLAFINYAICFSPDNKKLYFAINNPDVVDWHKASSLFQYNLEAGNPTSIRASKFLISDSISSVNVHMRVGPDGKIYIPSSYGNDTSAEFSDYFYDLNGTPATHPKAPDYPFHAYLGCIQNPDALGANSNFKRRAVALNPYSSAAEMLGGEFVKPIPRDSLVVNHDTTLCSEEDFSIVLSPQYPSTYFEWNDGSNDTQKIVTHTGKYWVRHGDYCHFQIDTFVVDVEVLEPVINVNEFTLSTTKPYISYQWLFNGNTIPGATNRDYVVVDNGNYSVIVSGEKGCKDTSAVYAVSNVGIQGSIHLAHQIRLFPNPATDKVYIQSPIPVYIDLRSLEGKEILKAGPLTQFSSEALAPGIYSIRLYDHNGAFVKFEKLVKL